MYVLPSGVLYIVCVCVSFVSSCGLCACPSFCISVSCYVLLVCLCVCSFCFSFGMCICVFRVVSSLAVCVVCASFE